jgi:hypothetical protein
MRKDHQSMTINGLFQGLGKRHFSHHQTIHSVPEGDRAAASSCARQTPTRGLPALTQVERFKRIYWVLQVMPTGWKASNTH